MNTHTAPRVLIRTLQMTVTGSSDVRDIVVRIGLPEPDPIPGGDFRVLVEIEGFDQPYSRHFHGVDELQAFLAGFDQPYSRHFHGVDELQAFLAGCWLVPQILPVLAPAGATLTWLGGDDLGFGTFSASPPASAP
jgi:hypothetical protein